MNPFGKVQEYSQNLVTGWQWNHLKELQLEFKGGQENLTCHRSVIQYRQGLKHNTDKINQKDQEYSLKMNLAINDSLKGATVKHLKDYKRWTALVHQNIDLGEPSQTNNKSRITFYKVQEEAESTQTSCRKNLPSAPCNLINPGSGKINVLPPLQVSNISLLFQVGLPLCQVPAYPGRNMPVHPSATRLNSFLSDR